MRTIQGLGRRRAHGGAGRRAAGQPVHRPRADVRRARRGRYAVDQETIDESLADAPAVDRVLPQPAAVPGEQRAADARAAAGRQALRGAAPSWPTRSGSASGTLMRATARPPPRCARRAAGLRRGPAPSTAGSSDLTRRSARLRADARVPRPRADDVQLPGAVVPQRLHAAERGRRPGHLAALHHRRHPARPQQRGQAPRRPGRRPDGVRTTCTSTRTRTRGPRASRRSASPPTSPTSRAQGARQRARHPAGEHGGQAEKAPPPRRCMSGLSPSRRPIALVVILVAPFLGFTKDIPFTKPFPDRRGLHVGHLAIRAGSPVRIAGVKVGKVKAVKAKPRPTSDRHAADQQERPADPQGRDASRSARASSSRATLRRPQARHAGHAGARPRRHDQRHPAPPRPCSSTRSSPRCRATRARTCGRARRGRTALNEKPTVAQDADADKSARGETRRESLNNADEDSAPR